MIGKPGGQEERKNLFLEELLALCRKHDVWISHEDDHGGFIFVVGPHEADRAILEKWISAAELERGA